MNTVVSALRLYSMQCPVQKDGLLSFLLHGASACSLFMVILKFPDRHSGKDWSAQKLFLAVCTVSYF